VRELPRLPAELRSVGASPAWRLPGPASPGAS